MFKVRARVNGSQCTLVSGGRRLIVTVWFNHLDNILTFREEIKFYYNYIHFGC